MLQIVQSISVYEVFLSNWVFYNLLRVSLEYNVDWALSLLAKEKYVPFVAFQLHFLTSQVVYKWFQHECFPKPLYCSLAYLRSHCFSNDPSKRSLKRAIQGSFNNAPFWHQISMELILHSKQRIVVSYVDYLNWYFRRKIRWTKTAKRLFNVQSNITPRSSNV